VDLIDLAYIALDWCSANSITPKIKIRVPVENGAKKYNDLAIFLYFPHGENEIGQIAAMQNGSYLFLRGSFQTSMELYEDGEEWAELFDGTLEELKDKGASFIE
jgi:hypothetical protein